MNERRPLRAGRLPDMRERQYNYEIHKGGRFARAADAYAADL